MDAAPQPTQPEAGASPEATEEKLNVYELTPSKNEAEKILDGVNPTETKSGPTAAPLLQSQMIEEQEKMKQKEQSLLNVVETSLKIKKPATPLNEDGQPKKPTSFWVEQVQKVIKLFRKEPYTEQQKAQMLEEGYLKDQNVELKDNGEKK